MVSIFLQLWSYLGSGGSWYPRVRTVMHVLAAVALAWCSYSSQAIMYLPQSYGDGPAGCGLLARHLRSANVATPAAHHPSHLPHLPVSRVGFVLILYPIHGPWIASAKGKAPLHRTLGARCTGAACAPNLFRMPQEVAHPWQEWGRGGGEVPIHGCLALAAQLAFCGPSA